MTRFIIHIILLIQSLHLFGQNFDKYSEAILLNTDRNIYISGESIHFSAHLIGFNSDNNKPISKIAYLELITPNGKQIVGNKFLMAHSLCEGIIEIPDDLLSGNYYLRGYTRFMRNCGPEDYIYVPLKIVNPYKKDLANTFNDIKPNKNLVNNDSLSDNTNKLFDFNFDKSVYRIRENVVIDLTPLKFKEKIISHTISVALEGIIKTDFLIKPIQCSTKELRYLPETRGASLSGILQEKDTGKGIQLAIINLSIIRDNGNIFYSTVTDSTGKFYFTFPEIYQNEDLFISTKPDNEIEYKILVENDFCTNEINLPNPSFTLSENEKLSVFKLVSNYEVDKYFGNDNTRLVDTLDQEESTNIFYGIPSGTLYLDEFINLSTLENYFTELPFLVKIRKEKGEKFLKLVGNHPELSIYKPLIMVDMVPIYNTEAILNTEAKNIEKIDVITSPYQLGNIIYGGIINIISVNNDFAGIDLPDNGIFLNYEFLKTKENLVNSEAKPNIPDTRNSLYWKTINTDNIEKLNQVKFTTADTPGKYCIIIKSLTDRGNVYYSTSYFNVIE